MKLVLLLPWPEGAYIGDAVLSVYREQGEAWAREHGFDFRDASSLAAIDLREAMESLGTVQVLGVAVESFLDGLGGFPNLCKVELLPPSVALDAAARLRMRLVSSWLERGLTPLTDIYFGESLPQMEASMTKHLRAESWT